MTPFRWIAPPWICALAAAALASVSLGPLPRRATEPRKSRLRATAYLGFDANDYPGDEALRELRKTFAFAGYWLNTPPGGNSKPWAGKRETLARAGFGFLVLFNGRLQRELRDPERAKQMGKSDARAAAADAGREGFAAQTIIFLDQEEGGSMEPEQMAYVEAWVDGIAAAGYRAGIYCSGMPAAAGKGVFVITAEELRERLAPRRIAFFVYNDACPPSPGCAFADEPPPPSASGVAFATVWQFAQSPRRKRYTRSCARTYFRDGNCYAPGLATASGRMGPYLDIESATSANPSETKSPE